MQRETYPNGVRKVLFRDPDGNEMGFGGAPLQLRTITSARQLLLLVGSHLASGTDRRRLDPPSASPA